ncbi:hypothetical protein BD410DRAFT_846298 [Rickenella mellea]|uniref:Uncharacterized protein n=1 Tax=Rickenella mellea TaxID=50990 RepID=A0A4Y7PHY7_9AGAM|nr:hypothetical protein BD410DRAFT_846298 [Rickenella mellea]
MVAPKQPTKLLRRSRPTCEAFDVDFVLPAQAREAAELRLPTILFQRTELECCLGVINRRSADARAGSHHRQNPLCTANLLPTTSIATSTSRQFPSINSRPTTDDTPAIHILNKSNGNGSSTNNWLLIPAPQPWFTIKIIAVLIIHNIMQAMFLSSRHHHTACHLIIKTPCLFTTENATESTAIADTLNSFLLHPRLLTVRTVVEIVTVKILLVNLDLGRLGLQDKEYHRIVKL